MNKLFLPQKVFVEKAARDLPLVCQILGRLKGIPVEAIDTARSLLDRFKNQRDPIGEGKRSLLLAYDRGRSFKPFPETEDYLSCDYHTLHIAEGCDLECSYCILQAYLTNPLLTVYVNAEEIFSNLEKFLNENPDQFFRIGTGQLADSLSMDHLTAYSEILVPFFARQTNAVLELKTKSVNIDRLLRLDPAGKTIISWSMNSKRIQTAEEHKCASLEERIEAAKKLSGYRVGFHFDPIIDYPGWEEDYEAILQKIFSEIPEERIAWISLGCLRFMPELKTIMQERFPRSPLPEAEWIRGMDGKLRYFKPRRVEIYRRMVEKIKRQTSEVTLYLSMESPEVWRSVFGEDYTRESVCQLLNTAASR